MCGVAGIIAKKNDSGKLLNHIFEMNNRLRHRGPDDEGFAFFDTENILCTGSERTIPSAFTSDFAYAPVADPKILPEQKTGVLAHNRLSILDVSAAGHQPMCDASRRYWIVYNGEIYNFPEIKQTLEQHRYEFHTHTDTEVILNAYHFWGADCVQHFNGMWAFCIYDSVKKELFLSRDRFGVKPLYYRNSDRIFAFASEQKALYDFPGERDDINIQAAFDYLSMGLMEAEPENFVQGIYELMPSHNAVFSLNSGAIQTWKYYSLNYNNHWHSTSDLQRKDYLEVLSEKVYQSVERRLISDVPVGTCLSGGLDSSVIVSTIAKMLDSNPIKAIGSQQRTFTSCFPGSAIDEEKWAEIVVKHTHADWYRVQPTSDDFLSNYETMVYHQDIPFFGSSTYSHYCVMRRVQAEGIKVTLDGQGADELFGGYAQHYSAFMNQALKHGDAKVYLNNLKDTSSNFSNYSNLLGIPAKYLAGSLIGGKAMVRKFRKKNIELGYIQQGLWEKHGSRVGQLYDKFTPNLNQLLHREFTGPAFKNLLRTADRNAMRFSVESRMPFADDTDLIEYVFGISGSYKIKDSYSKSLLRDSSSSLLPQNILYRRDKIGFATPEQTWFKEKSDALRQFIPDNDDEFVNWQSLKENWDTVMHFALQKGTTRLWRLINFAVWRKVYNI